MATHQHLSNTAMAENQALLTSGYLDAQSISNAIDQLNGTS
jgi:hypothetical protein